MGLLSKQKKERSNPSPWWIYLGLVDESAFVTHIGRMPREGDAVPSEQTSRRPPSTQKTPPQNRPSSRPSLRGDFSVCCWNHCAASSQTYSESRFRTLTPSRLQRILLQFSFRRSMQICAHHSRKSIRILPIVESPKTSIQTFPGKQFQFLSNILDNSGLLRRHGIPSHRGAMNRRAVSPATPQAGAARTTKAAQRRRTQVRRGSILDRDIIS